MFNFWKALFISCELLSSTFATSLWFVTENGRIHAQEDSPYNMRRPDDLLALLEQEDRVREVALLYKELVRRKAAIDKQWAGMEGAGDLEARLHAQDEDCQRAGRQLADHDLYGGVLPGEEQRDLWASLGEVLPEDGLEEEQDSPDCSSAVELQFSMQAFEHLPGMARRSELNLSANTKLASLFGRQMSLQQFGGRVSAGLRANASSWELYNLASLYWQMMGHGPNALECARRAVHLAPREHRGSALLDLGSIFHQAHLPKEAAIVLHAAVDHQPLSAPGHFLLGNVYAVLGDTNRSVVCYENAESLRPDWEHVSRTKHVLLCHRKLEQELLQLHGSLQGVLAELHGYHVLQEQWLRLQERIAREKAPPDHNTLTAVLAARVQSCRQKVKDGRSVLSCNLGSDTQRLALSLQMDVTQSLQLLLRNVEAQAKEISKQLSSVVQQLRAVPNSSRPKEPWVGDDDRADPPEPAVPGRRGGEGWPSREECAALAGGFPDLARFPSAFLPPESKGFQVQLYLGELLGLPFGAEHKLPWSPPLCGGTLPGPRGGELSAEPHLRTHLLAYVNDGRNEVAEVGQRIRTALTKEVGPPWLLQTLASLYWRVHGHPRHAEACLEAALGSAPREHRDVPLVSLGSLLARLGRLEEAARLAEEALAASSVEPSTHFLAAAVLSARGNWSGAAHHLTHVLRLEPGFISDGLAARLLLGVSCRLHFGRDAESSTGDPSLEDTCGAPPASGPSSTAQCSTLVSGMEGLREGEALVCRPDGEQCRAVQCFSAGDDPVRGSAGSEVREAVSCLLSRGVDRCAGRLVLPEPSWPGTDETDETELERMTDESGLPEQFDVHISLTDEDSQEHMIVPLSPLDDTTSEGRPRGDTYPLSLAECERVRAMDWEEVAAAGQRSAMRDISVELPAARAGDEEPLCRRWVPPSSLTLDHLVGVRAGHGPRMEEERSAAECLGAITGLHGSSTRELGTRIAAALQENATSWVLATAAALYWRAVGDTDRAVACLRQALQYVPGAERDIPLVGLASLLHRAGFFSDALVVANLALEAAPRSEVTHFTVANIHTSLGDLEKAIAHHHVSLRLRPGFEPARSRLQSILCSLMFEEHAVRTGP